MSRFTEKIKKFPTSPGIYLFYNKKRELIYIGKATSLRERVRSYFVWHPLLLKEGRGVVTEKISHHPGRSKRPPLLGQEGSSRPIEAMIHEVADIKIIKTDSVLEAVILEGKYIKKFLPKYNVDWKDDKSWNYLIITNDKFSRLLAVREREMENALKHKSIKALKQKTSYKLQVTGYKFVFGPFPSLNTRETLKILHKLFYISRCQPSAPLPLIRGGLGRGRRQDKPCFDYQIGHCLGVCIGEISAKDYEKKVVKPLVAFLSGEKKRVLVSLNNVMKTAAKNENFEEAGRLRNQISALKHIQDVTLLNKEFYKDTRKQKLENGNQKRVTSYGLRVTRIEAYDISNLGDSGKVGSMIVFDESGPIKSEYRKFKIKTVAGQSDVDCLKEVLARRLNHAEWLLPNLILVDGGAPQVNAMGSVLQENKIDLPIIGIAKGMARKKNEFIFGRNSGSWQNWVMQNGGLLIQARDEAHRFAISYQKKLRRII